MSHPPQPQFLDDLARDPEGAWEGFVREWSDLLLAVVSRVLQDPDLRMDAYLFALEAYRADDFRRLRAYRDRPAGHDAPFVPWLKLATRNLALDFIRHERGRRSLPRTVERRDGADQLLFRCLYWDGLSYAESYEVLSGAGHRLAGIDEVAERAGGLSEALRVAGHPLASGARRSAMARAHSLEDPDAPADLESAMRDGAEGAGYSVPESPDAALERRERNAEAARLLSQLDDEERLLLRLRYEGGLTADQIAPMIGAATAKAVYRRLDRLTASLRARAGVEGRGESA